MAHSGHCLCGAIRYELDGEIGDLVNCHCQFCRRAHGAAFATTTLVATRDLRVPGGEYLIVRTSWLYAPHGSNFVRTMLRLGAERDTLDVVDDQRGRPTYSVDLADATLELINAGARGVVHVANNGECTWCEFASAVMQRAGLDCEIKLCPTSMHPRPAARPAYGVLDLRQTTYQQVAGQV